MLIVQIGQYPLNPDYIRGGVESSVYGLVTEQVKSHSVAVLDIPRLDGKDSVDHNGSLTIYRFRNQGTHQKDAASRVPDMLEIICGLRPTICHLHGTGQIIWRLFKALKREGVPVIVTVHGLASVEKKKSLKKCFSLKTLYQFVVQSSAERKLLNATNEIIVDTQYVEEAIRHYHIYSLPHMSVIPQGISDSFFNLSCSNGSRMVLSVGAISPRKGHLFLIKAFEMLCERLPDVHLTICGSIADPSYFAAIQKHLSSSPYSDRISLCTDVHKDELLDLYQKAHVFALHSQEESQGIVFAEAMAVGLPVVSTQVGGIQYVVKNNETGFLSPYGDIASCAGNMEVLLTQHSMWEEMSQRCRLCAVRYSWTNIANTIEKLYLSIINR